LDQINEDLLSIRLNKTLNKSYSSNNFAHHCSFRRSSRFVEVLPQTSH